MARAAAGAGFANVTAASSAALEALVEAAVRAVAVAAGSAIMTSSTVHSFLF